MAPGQVPQTGHENRVAEAPSATDGTEESLTPDVLARQAMLTELLGVRVDPAGPASNNNPLANNVDNEVKE